MTEPIRDPGWYRIKTWEPVAPEVAKAEIEAGGGEDLIFVQEPRAGGIYQSSERPAQ